MSNFRTCHSTRVELSKAAVEVAVFAHVYDQIKLRIVKMDREIARMNRERDHEIEELRKYEAYLSKYGI